MKKIKKENSNIIFRILTAREKRFRQKYHNDAELKAYEKRLHDVEKKIRVLVKRGISLFYFDLRIFIEFDLSHGYVR